MEKRYSLCTKMTVGMFGTDSDRLNWTLFSKNLYGRAMLLAGYDFLWFVLFF